MREAGKVAFLSVFLLLILGSLFAAGAGSFILPPSLPEEGPTINLEVVDAQTRGAIVNTSVIIAVSNAAGNETEKTIGLTKEDGKVSLSVEKGSLRLVLYIDNFNTAGSDYVSREFAIDSSKNLSGAVEMFPAGSLAGEVYDTSGSRVEGAELKFACAGEYGDESAVSDKYGGFSARYLPAGECTVSAMSGNMVGAEKAMIEQGKVTRMKVELGETLASAPSTDLVMVWAAGAVVLILIVGAVVLLLRKREQQRHRHAQGEKKEQEISEQQDKEAKPAHHPRADDVMKTLDEKEKSVVEFLIKNEGKARQSKVYYGTKIPKTSLYRVLRSLERKNVIKASKFENLKEIELTSWFLGKEG